MVRVSLPPRGIPRDRWLTRQEAAALIWHCWRHREKQTIHSGASKGDPVSTNRRPLRHVARFILMGLYTGTRAGAIASASPYAEPGRSYVDLERGIFYRKPIGKRATKKRQTPAPIPPAAARALASVERSQANRRVLRRVQRQASCIGEEGVQQSRRTGRPGRQGHPAYLAPYRRDLANAAGRIDLGSSRVPWNVPGNFARHLWPPSPRLPARCGGCDRSKRLQCFGGQNGGQLYRKSNAGGKPREKWSERQDSNLRPLRPERSAYMLSC